VVVTTDDAGPGSFRQALLDANANPGLDTIEFNLGGDGVHTIRPESPLPAITDPVVIDGSTQPGYAGTPVIEVDGSDAGPGADGLSITAGNSMIRGLAINQFTSAGIRITSSGGNLLAGDFLGTDAAGVQAEGNRFGIRIESGNANTIGGITADSRNIISGNMATGLDISSNSNIVAGNFIGTDVTGSSALGNNGGIDISGFALGNIVGGTLAGAHNLISGNRNSGIVVNFASNTDIQGNYIGTDISGSMALGNHLDGITIRGDSYRTTVGGAIPEASNLISGNWQSGVQTSSDGTLILGNRIGTDGTGTQAVPNETGVLILNARADVIGATTPGSGNLISGNTVAGVAIDGSDSLVLGNFIGTDISGTAALPNGTGIGIAASDNTIGGTDPGAGNLISGNTGYGITISASGNQVRANLIGVDASGSLPLGNGGGVGVFDASMNLIGGSDAGAGNVIAFNGVGVLVDEATGVGIHENTIFGNSSSEIRLTDGGNHQQEYPVLTAAWSDGVQTTIQGMLASAPDTPFTIEFFLNNEPDPSGNGQGEIYLDSTTVMTDDTGNASFVFTLPYPVSPGQFLTATATDPGQNTSGFSGCCQVAGSFTRSQTSHGESALAVCEAPETTAPQSSALPNTWLAREPERTFGVSTEEGPPARPHACVRQPFPWEPVAKDSTVDVDGIEMRFEAL
jgi:hypothetical protein